MRLFSTFDTSLEQRLLKKYQDSFGKDMVVSIHKSKLFLITKVLIPYIRFLLFFGILLTGVYSFDYPEKRYVIWVFWVLILILLLYTVRKTSAQYVDYRMDFLIVTPKEVVKYNQNGLLNRDTQTIHVDKIRSISVAKHGLIESFFDIWSITFLAEWDDDKWDIIMHSIDAVESATDRISHVMWLDS